MKKPLKYTLAVIACIACYAMCIFLMVVTGVGGVIAMLLMCYLIKYVWNGIVHYGEEDEYDKIEKELIKEQMSDEISSASQTAKD